MKKNVLLLVLLGTTLVGLSAQTKKNREPLFNGTSAEAAEWITKNDRLFRSIAGDVSKVVTYSGSVRAQGSGVSILFYDFSDPSKAQMGVVLEITDKSTGNIIYVVWTNEARGDDAVFFNDKDKVQLDVSVASKGRKYGMSNDTLKHVKTIIAELK